MFVAKIKSVLAGLVIVALCAAAGLTGRTHAGEQPKAQPPAAKGAKAKVDDEQLQGKWTLTEFTFNGKKVSFEGDTAKLIVRKGVLHFKVSEDGKEAIDRFFTYKLDPAAAVKTIDLADWDKGFEENGEVIEGVYAVDGDTFSICIGEDAFLEAGMANRSRPASLESKDGSKTVTWTFKRVK